MSDLKGNWLLCAPKHYDVSYEINAWMHVDNRPDRSLASKQWNTLKETLEKIGCNLRLIEQEPGLPDMVFTANGGLISGSKAILPSFAFKERQGETPFFQRWFNEYGLETIPVTNNFEGEGDALFVGNDTLFCGFGFRSSPEAYNEISKVLGLSNENLIHCHLIDPYFYHLDTCFCPLNDKIGFYYPGAFTKNSQADMERRLSLFKVPQEEARRFACNAVVLGSDVVLPTGCRAVCDFLRDKGFTPHEVEMSEYLKAGGAAKCLSLRLDRPPA